MTDEELLAKVSAARGAAHRAPFAEWSKDHRDHSSIVNHTSAWATRGAELMAFADELERRGLKLPSCDCPPGAHDWEQSSLSRPLRPDEPAISSQERSQGE
jgi:hypothetical protein